MKKIKIVMVIAILSITLMGVGYAMWAESVTINSTVSTGELKVEFVESYFPVEVHDDYSKLVEVDRKQNALTIKCNNMYPGMWLSIPAQIENKGTIPVVFDDVEVVFKSGSDDLKEQLMVSMLNYDLYAADDKEDPKFSSEPYEDIKLTELEGKLRLLLANVRLEPGEYANINSVDRVGESVEPFIDLYVSDDAGNNVENQSLEFDIVIKWKQFNE